MRVRIISVILLLTTTLTFGQSLPKVIGESDFSIGKIITIESSVLSETRDLNIYLPLNYSKDSLRTYPIIYLFDGSIDEDFIHISGIVQFGSFSWINMIPETIVVGIGNVDRKRDFTYPSNSELDQKEFPTSGNSGQFIDFLEIELQPLIESTYRTNNIKTVIGQSLGGLLATEILFDKPYLFDNYIIVSPSLWWDDEKLLEKTPNSLSSVKSIYIAGGKEGEVMERTTEELFNKLKESNVESTKLHFDYLEDKTHGDALHIAVYNAFEKMFRPINE